MPKRERSGEVSSPVRVVAPMSVNFLSRTLTVRALGPCADQDVDVVVLERRIENLLDDRRHAMDLVDEQHVARRRGWSGCRARSPGFSIAGPEVARIGTPSSLAMT